MAELMEQQKIITRVKMGYVKWSVLMKDQCCLMRPQLEYDVTELVFKNIS